MGWVDRDRISQLVNFVINTTSEDRHLYLLLDFNVSLFYENYVIDYVA